jgi:hypothetical protein
MSRLTVTEKEHWKEGIERRLDKAIHALVAKDLSLMPAVTEAAERAAHKALGTADLHARIEAIQHERDALEKEQRQLEAMMYCRALGKDIAQVRYPCGLYGEFSEAVRKQQERMEEELLAETPLGQQILKLRAEKDSLLDTVWLATSSSQIRDLWSRVSVVLGEEETPLQRQILSQDDPSRETA